MTRTDVVFVVTTPFGAIALTEEQLRSSVALARTLTLDTTSGLTNEPSRGASPQGARLVDAAEAARELGVKESWLLGRAREHRVPHLRIGRYVRFDLAQLREALTIDEGTIGVPRDKR